MYGVFAVPIAIHLHESFYGVISQKPHDDDRVLKLGGQDACYNGLWPAPGFNNAQRDPKVVIRNLFNGPIIRA